MKGWGGKSIGKTRAWFYSLLKSLHLGGMWKAALLKTKCMHPVCLSEGLTDEVTCHRVKSKKCCCYEWHVDGSANEIQHFIAGKSLRQSSDFLWDLHRESGISYRHTHTHTHTHRHTHFIRLEWTSRQHNMLRLTHEEEPPTSAPPPPQTHTSYVSVLFLLALESIDLSDKLPYILAEQLCVLMCVFVCMWGWVIHRLRKTWFV